MLAVFRRELWSAVPVDQSMTYNARSLPHGLVTASSDWVWYDSWSRMPISSGKVLQMRTVYRTYVATTSLPHKSHVSAAPLGSRVGLVEPQHDGAATSLTSGLSTEAMQDALPRSGASSQGIEDALRNLREGSGV